MNKRSIGSRALAMFLAIALIIPMVPALVFDTSAAAQYVNLDDDGVNFNYNSTITMPLKIMDYETDGMMFDFMLGSNGAYDQPSDYRPESNYWADFTGTLTHGTTVRNDVYRGSGFDEVALDSVGDKSYNNEAWMRSSISNLGGKQHLHIVSKKENGIPLMWNIASFGSTGVTVKNVRYVTVVYLDYVRKSGSSAPKMGISSALDADMSKRYSTGNFSNWFYLPTDTIGKWQVDFAVIDLHDGGSGNGMPLTKTVKDLYLDFPMDPTPSDTKYQTFKLFAVGCFPNADDAEEFGYWGASVGCASDTDTYTDASGNEQTLATDSFSNNNSAFSFMADTTSTFGDVSQITEWIYNNRSKYSYGNGDFPVWLYDKKDMSTGYGRSDSREQNDHLKIKDSIGYQMFGTFGKNFQTGYSVVGLLESSLDENGLPVYKESVMNYMQIYLRNRFRDAYAYDLDGWMNYSAIRGARNGEIFGYTDGGQKDMDPSTPGVQGIPMDFATALAKQLEVTRLAADRAAGTQNAGKEGSYAQTMAKRKYLQGSWLDCKQYIKTWWDAAYYILHNLFVPNSYNELQNDYNYLILPQNGTGNYVFDAGFTKDSSHTSAVLYDKTNKTISLSGSKYKSWLGVYNPREALYNPFIPIPGETTTPYYLEDGVNGNNSGYGYNLKYANKNYNYAMVCNGEFTYEPGLHFTFEGDDDVYLFINGELVMDLGSAHNNACASFNLDDYVTWANNVLKNRSNYTLAEVARAEKLALVNNRDYSFDFFYMERHGTGANLRIETNIKVVVPELEVDKYASQDGVEVPDKGVVDNNRPVEYGFSLTNNGDTSKLYNLSFVDSSVGVKLTPSKGLEVTSVRTKDQNGGTLDASDLVAYVDGYDGDPSRPKTNKLDTIEVHFADNEALKRFLTDLTATGTQPGSSDGLYEGSGLWAYATVTIRGIYYTQSAAQQGEDFYTNTVKATATNGAYTLSGKAQHTVFKYGEPCYFQWAGHEIIIDSEKLYEDLCASSTYGPDKLPALGNMVLTLCDAQGLTTEYDHVSNSTGGDVYLSVNYPTGGVHTFFLKIQDKTGAVADLFLAVIVYTVDVKDSALVLDYGLTADLTDGNGLFNGDVFKFPGKETLNEVIGIAEAGIKHDYVEEDVSDLHSMPNTSNGITMEPGYSASNYIGKLDSPIYLKHDMPWVIEWQTNGSHPSGLMFSFTRSSNGAAEGVKNYYMYVRNNSTTGSSVEDDFIALGHYYNSLYDNHGISLTANGLSHNTGHTYRLENYVRTDGSNEVRLSVDGKVVGSNNGKLDTYWLNTTKQPADTAFISGQDFIFNYFGTEGHRMKLDSFNYIKVWEDGQCLNNYRWEWKYSETYPEGRLEGVTTGAPGNVANSSSWRDSSSGTDTDGSFYAFGKPVQLHYDKEWVVEYKYSGLDLADHPDNVDKNDEEVMIMVSTQTSYREYIYMRADMGLVSFGTGDSVGYHNYGIALKEIDPNFDTSAEHIYRLENHVNSDGTCMVYLFVDGKAYGAMDNYYPNNVFASKGDVFSGNNFMFTHAGHNDGRWPIDGTLHYLQVWEDTALTTSYHMVREGTGFSDASVRDINGNRIEFTPDADGKITSGDGKFTYDGDKLTFQPSKLMEGESKATIAVSIHDRDSIHTPLDKKFVDIANEVQAYKTITVVPATIVYYEDDFPAIKFVDTQENSFTQIGTGSGDLTQGSDQDSNYGSDDAYDSSFSNMSGDSLYQIPIDHMGPLVYFDFTGTGFELLGRTNATTAGMLFVDVYLKKDLADQYDANGELIYDDATGMVDATPVKSIPVITQYDNNNDKGAEEVHQVPVIRAQDLGLDDYTVIISGVPSNIYDDDRNIVGVKEMYFFLDGIRIFEPLGPTNGHYSDKENGATITEIRNEIIDGKIAAADCGSGITLSAGLTTWTENNTGSGSFGQKYSGQEVSSVNDYLVLGPNNEVYMDGTFTSSAIVLLVKETGTGVHDLQIAMRAIDYGIFIGAGHIYESAKMRYGVMVDGVFQWADLATITTGTEQYYTIPYSSGEKLGDHYMVALQVVPVKDDVPAMISFSYMKTNGIELGSISNAVTSGIGELSGEEVLESIDQQLSSTTIYHENESEPGSDLEGSGDPTALITPKYPTVSFESEIVYNFYFDADGLYGVSPVDMGLLVFDSKLSDGTVDDALDLIPGAMYDGSIYMVRTHGIPAKCLGDTLYYKIYAKLEDGSFVYSDVFGYNAVVYAKDCLRNSDNEAMRSLVVAMLNYGAAAQEFFGYHADDLMNDWLTEEQKALTVSFKSSMIDPLPVVDTTKAGEFVLSEGSFTSIYPSVSFDGDFSINYYMTPGFKVDSNITFYYWDKDTYDSVDILTTENANGCRPMVALENGAYWAEYCGIAAKQIDDPVYIVGVYECDGITYSTGVIVYSLGAYCKSCIDNGSEQSKALAAATAVYGHYAEGYFVG